jgi:hypothetical protein
MSELQLDMDQPEIQAGPAPQRAPRRGPRTASTREPMRDAPRNGVFYGRDGEVLTRKRKDTGDIFAIPSELMDPDFEYQWNAVSVAGNQEILLDQNMMMSENGWRPVPADRPGFAGRFTPVGAKGSIIRGGQRLDERPRAMCDDARAEERAKAMQQMRDKDAALTGGKANFNGTVSEDMREHRGARPRGRVDTDRATYGPQPSYQPPDD